MAIAAAIAPLVLVFAAMVAGERQAAAQQSGCSKCTYGDRKFLHNNPWSEHQLMVSDVGVFRVKTAI
jgi:hypothetical protein